MDERASRPAPRAPRNSFGRSAAVLGAALLAGACGDFQEGVAVTVRSEVQALATQQTLSDGSTLTVTAASLSVSAVLLHSCEQGTSHHQTGAGATLLSLLAAGEQDLGRFNPPAGAYCEVEVKFGPADEGSAALPAESRDAVLGTTLRLAGAVGALPLSLRSDATASVTLPVDVVLDETHRDAALALSLDAPAALAGLDLTAPDAAGKLLERLSKRVALVPRN